MFEVHVIWKRHTSILLFMIFFKIIAARNHVNRMCLAADVPLVESGTAGYLGQATVIKKVWNGYALCFLTQTQKLEQVLKAESVVS